MSSPIAATSILFPGFAGMDESHPGAGPDYVREGLNLDFKDGRLQRRKGRTKLLDSYAVRPTKVYYLTGTPTDVTGAATDGDTTTTAVTLSVGGWLLVGFPFRVSGLRLTVTAAITGAANMIVSVFNRGSGVTVGAWDAVSVPFSDGTAGGGSNNTLQQTGDVIWPVSVVNGVWTPGGAASGNAEMDAVLEANSDLFWVRITTTGAPTGGTISEVSGLLKSQQNLLLRSEEFDHALWAKFASGTGSLPVVTTNAGTAPNNTVTAERIQFAQGAGTSVSDYSIIGQMVGGLAVGRSYVYSVYLKLFPASPSCQLMLTIGSNGVAIYTITDTWRRYTVATVATLPSMDPCLMLRGTFTPSGSVADVLAWGAQLEEGTDPGAGYMPTTANQSGESSIRTGSLGVCEFITRTGDSYLVSTSVYPDIGAGDSVAGARSDLRVLAYDLGRGDAIPVRLPVHARNTEAGADVTYQVVNGWLLGSTPAGTLWKFNGTESDALETLIGNDAINGVLGAQSYFAQGPTGTKLELYRNRLMVTGDPSAPMNFYASLEDNDISTIPPAATVGGPNVWPLKYVFRVPGRAGDRIMNAAVINDRYVILTRSSIWAFDDVSLINTNPDIGCVASGSVQKIDNSIIFLAEDGLATTNGREAAIISDPIRLTLESINPRALERAASVHHASESEYWLWVPLDGDLQNSLAIVFNYKTKAWRTVAGWFPWDTYARRQSFGNLHNVSAACTMTGSGPARVLVSIDESGAIWHEGVGHTDGDKVYPAYAVLRDISQAEDFLDLRSWYLGLVADGQWFEFLAVVNGDKVRNEIDRRLSNVATLGPIVNKQALLGNCIEGLPQKTFSTVAFWGDTRHAGHMGTLKASFGRSTSRMKPVILWAPGEWDSVSGAYKNQTPARGAIVDISVRAADPNSR